MRRKQCHPRSRKRNSSRSRAEPLHPPLLGGRFDVSRLDDFFAVRGDEEALAGGLRLSRISLDGNSCLSPDRNRVGDPAPYSGPTNRSIVAL